MPSGEYDDVGDFLDQHPDRVGELYFDAFPLFDDPKWVERFKAAGYDGAIHGGNGESALTAEYKVFDRSQVKPVEAAPAAANDPLPDLEPHLDDADKAALAEAYDRPSFDAEASRRFVDDFALAITKGLEHVGEAVREIIRKVQRAILTAAVLFNPGALGHLPAAAADLGPRVQVERLAELPAGSEGMTAEAQTVYRAMAPIAERTGKGFFIADKPGGKIHVFGRDGRLIASSPALYGKTPGDELLQHGARTLSELNAGPITPAGKYEVRFENSDYAGGKLGRLYELGNDNPSYLGGVAVHSVYLGKPSEGRLGRLASDTPADNKISHGCINTAEPVFVGKIVPNIAELDHGLIFILPENPAHAAAMFPAERTPAPGGAPIAPAPEGDAMLALPRKEAETPNNRPAAIARSPDPERILASQRGVQLEGLLARAQRNQVELAKIGKSIETSTGAKFLNPGAKKPERVRAKVADNKYSSPGELKDLARAGFVVSSRAQAQRIAEILGGHYDLYDKGWQNIGGYVDRKIIVKLENGGVAEIQFIPEQIIAYKNGEGHKLYEISQDPKTPIDEFNRVTQEMHSRYQELLAGSEFAVSGKRSTNAAADNSVPSTSALRASETEPSSQAPSLNTNEVLGSETAIGRSSSSKNLMASTSHVALDMGAKPDPSKALRDQLRAELGAAAPLRAPGGVDQQGEIGLPLMDAADQHTFRLGDEGGEISAADLLAELDADAKAVQTLKDCL
jgi:hypothetical protein